ncbi:hypothetical protein BKA70DRAFT_1562125 [Coprinopsis sp. MPI-PUGE-AT-0042]|nr:hypothetical protein BKA70DRAFT_1562125 [Coprinopsis sp. MPI-PUGE-AT-0042]
MDSFTTFTSFAAVDATPIDSIPTDEEKAGTFGADIYPRPCTLHPFTHPPTITLPPFNLNYHLPSSTFSTNDSTKFLSLTSVTSPHVTHDPS